MMAGTRFVVVYPSAADVDAFKIECEKSAPFTVLDTIKITCISEFPRDSRTDVAVEEMGHALFLLADAVLEQSK